VCTVAAALLAAQPPPCGKAAAIAATLAERFGETPAGRGLSATGSLLEVYASASGDTWTAVQVLPTGQACVIATGRDWQQLGGDRS
jgi:hypothetical protein